MSDATIEGESSCGDGLSTRSEEDFTQEQKDEMLEAFTFYDTDGDGLISTRDIATVMRVLGQAPTVCEETDIVAQFAIDQCNEIDFKAFLKLMKKQMKECNEEDELRESFRRFDKEETGVINVERLRIMLTTMGEPLKIEEVDDWLADAEEFIEDGMLKYESLATAMLSK